MRSHILSNGSIPVSLITNQGGEETQREPGSPQQEILRKLQNASVSASEASMSQAFYGGMPAPTKHVSWAIASLPLGMILQVNLVVFVALVLLTPSTGMDDTIKEASNEFRAWLLERYRSRSKRHLGRASTMVS